MARGERILDDAQESERNRVYPDYKSDLITNLITNFKQTK